MFHCSPQCVFYCSSQIRAALQLPNECCTAALKCVLHCSSQMHAPLQLPTPLRQVRRWWRGGWRMGELSVCDVVVCSFWFSGFFFFLLFNVCWLIVLLVFLFYFYFFLSFPLGGHYKGEKQTQRDWEISGVGEHDVKFPKESIKRLC